MYRIITAGFCATVIVLSLLGLQNPSGNLSIVMSTELNIALLRIVLVSLLLAYTLRATWRYELPRKSLLLASFGVLWFFLSATFVDSSPFPLPLDIFFGIEGAALSAIACFDFNRPKTVQKFMPQTINTEPLFAKLQSLKFLRPTLPTRHKEA